MSLEADSEPVPGYRLKNRLGTGGFAQVWEATAPDGKVVALKFIDAHDKNATLLRSEIRVLRSVRDLQHPNLVRLYDVFASSHYLVFCMERADGNLDQLRQAYREEGSRNIPADHLLELLAQAAEGLDYLAGLRLPNFNMSAAGMQHCDVKPGNLLLQGDVLKVADFGLCAGTGQQTHRKGLRGTAPYAAPELYQGRVCGQSDQYALAVTWCDLVAGERMFRKTVAPDGKLRISIDLTKARAREIDVLARALHVDPTRRYPSCAAFVAAMAAVVKLGRRPGGKATRTALPRPLAYSALPLGTKATDMAR